MTELTGRSISAMSASVMTSSEGKHVAIVGATGAVGQEMLDCLEERNFPISELTLLASARSAGKEIPYKGSQDIRMYADRTIYNQLQCPGCFFISCFK